MTTVPSLARLSKSCLARSGSFSPIAQADVAVGRRGFRPRVVARHDRRISYVDRAVHDILRWTHIGHGRFAHGLNELHFGAQYVLVEFDRLPTISFERDVRIHSQHHLSPLSSRGLRGMPVGLETASLHDRSRRKPPHQTNLLNLL